MHAHVRVSMSYVVINSVVFSYNCKKRKEKKALLVFSLCICLTLNYSTFNLNFVHLHVILMVCFKDSCL